MAPSRGVGVLTILGHPLLFRIAQRRAFHISATILSGHSRWSKIKHDKGKNDVAKHRQRTVFAQEIATASKLHGPDPSSNPRLFDLITRAKREGFAKASIESAIARGQGRSLTGVSLENVTIEGVMPNNVGLIVECETDNKLRTLQDVRHAIKAAGGVASPTSYLFEKRGRVVFAHKEDITAVDVLDAALDAGATDIADLPDDTIVVFTEPEQTRIVGERFSKAAGLDISNSGIVWIPNEGTKVELSNDDAVQDLCDFVDALHEKESSVQALAMNISQGAINNDSWSQIESRIGA